MTSRGADRRAGALRDGRAGLVVVRAADQGTDGMPPRAGRAMRGFALTPDAGALPDGRRASGPGGGFDGRGGRREADLAGATVAARIEKLGLDEPGAAIRQKNRAPIAGRMPMLG